MPDIARPVLTEVYSRLADTGRAPTVDELSAQTGASRESVPVKLNELHQAHDLVLGTDGEVLIISAVWSDDDSPFEMTVSDGALTRPDGLVHFSVPARRWWDDIVDT